MAVLFYVKNKPVNEETGEVIGYTIKSESFNKGKETRIYKDNAIRCAEGYLKRENGTNVYVINGKYGKYLRARRGSLPEIALKQQNNKINQIDLWDLRNLIWSKSSGSVASDGVYMKAEMTVNGIKYYLKLSNYDSYRGIYGHEAVNELIACRLGNILGFNVPEGKLRRSLVKIDGKEHESYVFVAKSYKTTESRESFENFYLSHRISDKESPLDLCKRFNWENEIYQMFVFDYLIINRDRHGANLEVMKSCDFKLSPLFDNGLSFVCSCTNEMSLKTFNIMEDRTVNNFIGEKHLGLNLIFIDKSIKMNILKESDKDVLFKGLIGVLPEQYLNIIWRIIWERWQNVKKFCIN